MDPPWTGVFVLELLSRRIAADSDHLYLFMVRKGRSDPSFLCIFWSWTYTPGSSNIAGWKMGGTRIEDVFPIWTGVFVLELLSRRIAADSDHLYLFMVRKGRSDPSFLCIFWSWTYTPGSSNIAGWKMGGTRIEDVFPIKNGDIPIFHCYVRVPEGTFDNCCWVFPFFLLGTVGPGLILACFVFFSCS